MKSIISLVIVVIVVSVVMPNQQVAALSGSDFNPGHIIDDAIFYNKDSMTASQIQAFLNSKVPNCDNDGSEPYAGTTRAEYGTSRGNPPPYTCLKEYSQDTPMVEAASGLCNSIGGGVKSAARIINDVAKACGINPQVLLVLLQKEQSLVTDNWPWEIQYEKATGFGCPDTAPCNPAYEGFFYQVYNAARQFKVYRAQPNSYSYREGRDNSIYWHPDLTRCGSSSVYIHNQATAGLYIYTPYRPNQAALNNLYGTGDSCSSYGNRNFWRLFNDWFGPTVGTPIFSPEGSKRNYILGSENNYYELTDGDALRSYGYGTTVSYIKTVPKNYTVGKTFSGKAPLVVRFESSAVYIIDEGELRQFTSSSMFNQFGYSFGDEAMIPQELKEYFRVGETVEPMISDKYGNGVWLVEAGKKRHIIDGETYRAGPNYYHLDPKLELSMRYIKTISNGSPVAVADRVFKSKNTDYYGFWDGSELQRINSTLAANSNVKIDYSAPNQIIDQLPKSARSTIRNLVRNGSNYYLINKNQALEVSSSEVPNTGYIHEDFIATPQQFIDRLSPGQFSNAFRVNNSNAVYTINAKELFRYASPNSLNEYGFTFNDVGNLDKFTVATVPNNRQVKLATGSVFKLDGKNPVYLTTDSGIARWIQNSDMLFAYGINPKSIKNFSQSQTSTYTPKSSTPLSFFAKDQSDQVWSVAQTGTKQLVSVSDYSDFAIDASGMPVISSVVFDQLTDSGGASKLVRGYNDTRVYLIESGLKKPFLSKADFLNNGYSFEDVADVRPAFINTFSTGSAVN